MPETNNIEKGDIIVIKPGSSMTVEQTEDLRNRTTHDIEVGNGKPKIVPHDRHISQTDSFDMIPQSKPDSPPSKQ